MNEFYLSLTFEEYQQLPGVSCSMLKDVHRSAFHYWYKHESGAKQKVSPTLQAAFDVGTALHGLVLENDPRYLVKPALSRVSKAGKEAHAKHQEELAAKDSDWVSLTAEQAQSVHGMAEVLTKHHPVSSQLLKDRSYAELSMVWERGNGQVGRGRVDGVVRIDGNAWILDLKTCQNVTPSVFHRHALNCLYHWQAAYYLEGLRACCQDGAPEDHGIDPPVGFLLIAVEKEPPHDVGVFQFDEETLEVARDGINQAWQRLEQHRAQLGWPGAVNGVQTLRCPRWLT